MFDMKRWHVIVSYRAKEYDDDEFNVEELEEIHNRIERGTDWRLIDAITITLNRKPPIPR